MAQIRGSNVQWPIKNKLLYAEIVKCKELDELTPDALCMLTNIAEHAITKMKYINTDDRDDCLSSAYLDLLKYWRSFNPKYKNAFAYFTEISKKGFAKGWNKLHPKKYKGTISLDSHSTDSDGVYTV